MHSKWMEFGDYRKHRRGCYYEFSKSLGGRGFLLYHRLLG